MSVNLSVPYRPRRLFPEADRWSNWHYSTERPKDCSGAEAGYGPKISPGRRPVYSHAGRLLELLAPQRRAAEIWLFVDGPNRSTMVSF